ncbi:hypothetical protein GGF42_007920 [Coemansia sp. RSA 2424]|nr:hypothetical protein GGF42_007920 [Coemansia sp. RSA 2424]
MPQMPRLAQMPSSMTQSLLSRLISYFDMSHISSVNTTTPVMVTHVFDPEMNKFTHLSMNIIQLGDVWYLPVCTVDSITAVRSAAALPVPKSCQYDIQLAPLPPERHDDAAESYAHGFQGYQGCCHGAHALLVWPLIYWHGHDVRDA